MPLMRRFPSIVAMGALLAVSLVALAACGSDDNKSTATTTAAASRSSGASSSAAATTTAAASRSSSATSSVAAGPEVKMIPSIKFEKTAITIDAGKKVTITVNNTDTGMRHNFALYKTKADADASTNEIAKTDICTAPCIQTVDVNLTAGDYLFHCNVHPTQMMGTLTAK
jgi:plastocyanin